ncbi:hypothetical protein M8J76_012617 [Diaphorina citri]|nr:hypothetical protein M8J76_012617 [Diaphorina citri]
MSTCQREGKDIIIFATKEDHAIPSSVELPPPEPQPGLILPDGSINWNCPCLGGMATGPCGVQFREAFSCFHYSTDEPKGVNCFEAFKTMQDCMAQYPTLYKQNDDDDDEDLDDVKDESIRKEAQEKADRIIEQADSSSSHTNKK